MVIGNDTMVGRLPNGHLPCYIRSMSAPLTFTKKNPKVVISTRLGNITIQFYTDVAPHHVDNFLNLAKIGFYNGRFDWKN